MLIGLIFKSTEPDETEEERRELERLVAEAAKPKKKVKKEKGGGQSYIPHPSMTVDVDVPPSASK